MLELPDMVKEVMPRGAQWEFAGDFGRIRAMLRYRDLWDGCLEEAVVAGAKVGGYPAGHAFTADHSSWQTGEREVVMPETDAILSRGQNSHCL